MKKLMMFSFVLISLLTACDNADLSVNYTTINILNAQDEVKAGDELKVAITVKDSEGIDYVLIEIPILSIEEKIEDYSEADKWKMEKHFLVEDPGVTGPFDIIITAIDKNGNENVDMEIFRIVEAD